MSIEAVLLAVGLCFAALGVLYAFLGRRFPGPWWAWTAKAVAAGGVAFIVGMALVGLPGAFFMEAILGPQPALPPDSAWPLALMITQVWALLVLPASSLALRFAMPGMVGWRHVGATALLTCVVTLLVTMLMVGIYAPP